MPPITPDRPDTAYRNPLPNSLGTVGDGERECGPMRAGEDGRQRGALRVHGPAGQLPGCTGRKRPCLADTLLPAVNQCRVPGIDESNAVGQLAKLHGSMGVTFFVV